MPTNTVNDWIFNTMMAARKLYSRTMYPEEYGRREAERELHPERESMYRDPSAYQREETDPLGKPHIVGPDEVLRPYSASGYPLYPLDKLLPNPPQPVEYRAEKPFEFNPLDWIDLPASSTLAMGNIIGDPEKFKLLAKFKELFIKTNNRAPNPDEVKNFFNSADYATEIASLEQRAFGERRINPELRGIFERAQVEGWSRNTLETTLSDLGYDPGDYGDAVTRLTGAVDEMAPPIPEGGVRISKLRNVPEEGIDPVTGQPIEDNILNRETPFRFESGKNPKKTDILGDPEILQPEEMKDLQRYFESNRIYQHLPDNEGIVFNDADEMLAFVQDRLQERDLNYSAKAAYNELADDFPQLREFMRESINDARPLTSDELREKTRSMIKTQTKMAEEAGPFMELGVSPEFVLGKDRVDLFGQLDEWVMADSEITREQLLKRFEPILKKMKATVEERDQLNKDITWFLTGQHLK